MKIGDTDRIAGCFTQEKFLLGQTLAEIEKLIGFQQGRLSQGAVILALTQLPLPNQFEVAGYNNVATHRFKMPSGLNKDVLKANARQQWATTGINRLVKVRPSIGHDQNLNSDIQYPPGYGVPQWDVTVRLPAVVTAILNRYPGDVYQLR